MIEGDELDPTKACTLDPVVMIAKMTLAMLAPQDQNTALQNTVKELKSWAVSLKSSDFRPPCFKKTL